mgnify:CR=1 FL=1
MAEIKVLRGREEIERAASAAASQILDWLKPRWNYGTGDKVIFLGVMKGGLPWMFKVMDYLPYQYRPEDIELEFIRLSSYEGGTESTGNVTQDLCGIDLGEWDRADIIVFEDVVDSGRSFDHLQSILKNVQYASLRYVVMALKGDFQKNIDFVGFRFDKDDFLVGFGLDLDNRYRTLNYIGRLCATS